jgi:hypothetical protein
LNKLRETALMTDLTKERRILERTGRLAFAKENLSFRLPEKCRLRRIVGYIQFHTNRYFDSVMHTKIEIS